MCIRDRLYIARRAFAGCTQLNRFQRTGKRMTWRGAYSRANAFLRCDNLDMPKWVFDGYHAIRQMRINGQMTPSESSTEGTRNRMWQRCCCHASQLAPVCWPCLRQRPSSLSIQTSKLPTKETSRSSFEKVSSFLCCCLLYTSPSPRDA